MLVLSRKIGEKIHIGDDVTIEVRRVAGNRVTIAVEAPRDVRILRGELQKAATEFDAPKGRQPAAPVTIETVVVSHQALTPMHSMPPVLG